MNDEMNNNPYGNKNEPYGMPPVYTNSNEPQSSSYNSQPEPTQYQQQNYSYGQPSSYNQQYNYNQNQYAQYNPDPATQKKPVGLAITSMVIGILLILTGCCFIYGTTLLTTNAVLLIPIILGILGVVLGIVSLVKKHGGKGMAITGIILGIISVITAGFFLLVFIYADVMLERKGYDFTYSEFLNMYLDDEISESEYDRIISEITT